MALLHEGELVALGTPDEMRACEHPLARRFLTAELHHPGPNDL